ncbi:hypothetical protein CROQUDRAFT_366753 [Cronartium quercuum f. sp. fusiforme G11]|uniref:Uncharacterized protein n=1 Tax=Cronartium quercuum f. sp. fusiforme G11 TaxID=708437 RepID=A0A9P6N6Y4_9BASI|nr:hypothetical protein CROQUDRAFT_366753 [Cronartium quercuum f. sp. fusiforme G11]
MIRFYFSHSGGSCVERHDLSQKGKRKCLLVFEWLKTFASVCTVVSPITASPMFESGQCGYITPGFPALHYTLREKRWREPGLRHRDESHGLAPV